MEKKKRVRHSPRATAALVLGLLALLVATSALVVAWLALQKSVQVARPTVSEEELAETWNEEFGLAVARVREPEERPWYGLCAPYAARTVEGFRAQVESNPLLRARFAGFAWDDARVLRLGENLTAQVSYLQDGEIRWTRKRLVLKAGERVITDGVTTVRSYCCNEVVDAPALPLPEDEVVDAPLRHIDRPAFRVALPPLRGRRSLARRGSGGADPGSAHLPEPGTLVLVGTGLAALAAGRAVRGRGSREG